MPSAVAIHEAGHAVAFHALGYRPFVQITPTVTRRGTMFAGAVTPTTSPAIPDDQRKRDEYMMARTCCCLVGFEAATVYAGAAIPSDVPGEDDDFSQAVRIIRNCMSPDAQIGAAEEAARRTRKLVAMPYFRRLTLFLAAILDARGELDPDEVDAALTAAAEDFVERQQA